MYPNVLNQSVALTLTLTLSNPHRRDPDQFNERNCVGNARFEDSGRDMTA